MAKRHGLSGTQEYQIWAAMKSRCKNPHDIGHKYYYDRGIKVCDEWLNSFLAFYTYMGKRPSLAHSIDRINVNGNYEPGNCRWATSKQQANNRRPQERYIKK